MSSLLRTRNTTLRTLRQTRAFVARPKHNIKDPLLASPNAEVIQLSPEMTFIHRPPPTAESPISLTTNPLSPLLKPVASSSSATLPPLLRPQPKPSSTRLSQSQIEEIKKLRSKDPKRHPAKKLAEKFGCSQMFVSMIAPIKEVKVKVHTPLDGPVMMSEAESRARQRVRAQERWGEKKRISRAVKQHRRELW